MKNKIYLLIIISFSLMFNGCTSKEFKDLPDDNPNEVKDISITIVLCSKYENDYKNQFSEISWPYRSKNCVSVAFVSKTLKITRLDMDSKKSIDVNTWGATGWGFQIVERIQGVTFEGIAQNVEDHFENFVPDDYLLDASIKTISLNELNSFIHSNNNALIYILTDSDIGTNNFQGIQIPIYKSIEDLRMNIADNLCETKKNNVFSIFILFRPNITTDSLSADYKIKIDVIKNSIENLPKNETVVTKAKIDELILKCNALIAIADNFIKLIEKGEREKQKKYLDTEILRLEKRIKELKSKIESGEQPPSPKTIHFSNNDRYVGETKEGKMHGFGAYYFNTRQIIWNDPQKRVAEVGYVLKGNWNNGKFDNGKLYNQNGKIISTIIIGQ